jgi:hypothetical protein
VFTFDLNKDSLEDKTDMKMRDFASTVQNEIILAAEMNNGYERVFTFSSVENVDYDISIQTIKDSDIIVYQNVDLEKSPFSNAKTLRELMKSSCKLIQIPSIYLIYSDFDNSIKELIDRENYNNVDIRVSNIFYYHRNVNLMINRYHPNTFLFLKIVKAICDLINCKFFTIEQCNKFLKNNNYMELPVHT